MLATRRSVLMERLRCMAASSGPCQPTWDTGSPAKAPSVNIERLRRTAASAAQAHLPGEGESRRGGGRCPLPPAGDGCHHSCGLSGWRDGESYVRSSWCLWSVCEGPQPPSARAHQRGGRGILPRRRSVPMERLRDRVRPSTWAHQLGGRGVVPRRWSVPTHRGSRPL